MCEVEWGWEVAPPPRGTTTHAQVVVLCSLFWSSHKLHAVSVSVAIKTRSERMSDQLRLRGTLKGHGGWVTQIATTPSVPDMILSASRGW